ncbi:MAG: trypsin-like peptidase domain-containing protein [Candidatus Latescibacteria bacterium]|nr:trypsin-like peptidase domain-containing protein [Candidatus Latescibacterota bacterium]
MRNLFTRISRFYSPMYYYFLFIVILLLTLPDTTTSAQLPVIRQGNSLQSPFTVIYEKVSPTVVRIDTKIVSQERTRNNRSPWDFFFDPQEDREQERQLPGMGSGVIVDRDGHILTNNHVIANATEISVKVNEHESYEAEVIGKDPGSDLAVVKLKLEGKQLPEEYVAELGDSDTLRPGDYAIAIGNPIGLERTINVGVVSALGRHGFRVWGGESPQFQDFIQTDAQINPGNSGGALADINGKVIGINDMYTAQYAGIGFAIPINLAKNVMTQLITTGEVKRGFVGIKADEEGITKEKQEALGLPSNDGVLISEVVEGFPGDKAGLKHGDVIITLNGKTVKNFQAFLLKIASYSPGEEVELEIIRNGDKQKVILTLADRNDYTETAALKPSDSFSWRGINVTDLDHPSVKDFNLGNIEKGVVVISIDPDSPASRANLRAGDVINEIENEEINNTGDFKRVREKISNLSPPDKKDKTILIFKQRVSSNGRIETGFVAVKSK